MSGTTADSGALTAAKSLGLVERIDRRWHLTDLGLEFCEGRIITTERRPGGLRFVATWLRSLPQGLKLGGV